MTGELYRVARYICVGLLNTAFGYGAYCALLLAGAPLWLAVAGSTILGVLFNFYSYGGLVFGGASHKFLPRFLMFYLLLGSFNFVFLRIVMAFGLGSFVAQALALPILAVCGYYGMRSFVFRSRNPDIRTTILEQAEQPYV